MLKSLDLLKYQCCIFDFKSNLISFCFYVHCHFYPISNYLNSLIKRKYTDCRHKINSIHNFKLRNLPGIYHISRSDQLVTTAVVPLPQPHHLERKNSSLLLLHSPLHPLLLQYQICLKDPLSHLSCPVPPARFHSRD